MSESGPSQFYELAEYYDAINDWKDYQSESKRVESIARRFGPRGRTDGWMWRAGRGVISSSCAIDMPLWGLIPAEECFESPGTACRGFDSCLRTCVRSAWMNDLTS